MTKLMPKPKKMNTLNMNCKLMLLFLFAQCASIVSFGTEKTDKIFKEYKVTSSTTVEIINKYGKIQVIPWKKDSVKIEVEVTLRSNSDDRLERIQNNVDFDFIHTPGFISAKTIIGSRNTSVWTDISTLTKTMFSNGSNMTINYVVYMPEKNKLIVENRYGDVFTGPLLGKVKIDLSHGDLKASTYTNNFELTLKYGNASIRSVESGTVTLEYADLHLETAERLFVTSKSGEVKIDQVDHLRIQARRGEYTIKKVETLIGESLFTNLNIIQLSEKIVFECRYGNLYVYYLPSNFKDVRLVIKYADVNLTFSESSSYAIEVSHKNSTITFPKDKALLNTTSAESDEKLKLTTGVIGTSSGSLSKVSAEMDRGTLNFYSK
jgi:hypothetical protein